MAKITSEQSDAAAQLDESFNQFRVAALQDGGRKWELNIAVGEDGTLLLEGGVLPKPKPKTPGA
jgi:hypothetical protein